MIWEKHFPILQLVILNNVKIRKEIIQMSYKPFLYRRTIKFHKIKATTRVWNIQIKLPCGFCSTKKDANVETSKLTICQVLN
jgi:hypothetical protein